MSVTQVSNKLTVSYRILSWEGGEGGGWQDDSSMRKHVWPLGGSGGISPQENFEFRSSQIASDAIWDELSKQACTA